MSSEDAKLAISVGLPSLLVLVDILITNHRLSDLNSRMANVNLPIAGMRAEMNARFDALTRLMETRFDAGDEKIDRLGQVMDARLKHLAERLR